AACGHRPCPSRGGAGGCRRGQGPGPLAHVPDDQHGAVEPERPRRQLCPPGPPERCPLDLLASGWRWWCGGPCRRLSVGENLWTEELKLVDRRVEACGEKT